MGSWRNGYLGELGTEGNEHWCKWASKQMDVWGKGVPKVRYAQFSQMFTNEHWGKWALGANVHLGERDTPSVLCQFSQFFLNGQWRKWALGANRHLGNFFQVPIRLGAYFALHLWYPLEHLRYPFLPSVQVPICKHLGKWTQGT